MPRKRGRTLRRETCVRWALTGKQGVKLQTLMVGGIRCTCDAWAMEFFTAITNGTSGQTAKSFSPRQRHRDHQDAEAELDRLGIS
jgi:hypothetical protein